MDPAGNLFECVELQIGETQPTRSCSCMPNKFDWGIEDNDRLA